MPETSESGASITGAILIVLVLIVAATPYVSAVRRYFDLLPRAEGLVIPEGIEVTSDAIRIEHPASVPAVGEASALARTLSRIESDPESEERSFRVARVQNTTDLTVRFRLCAHHHDCADAAYVVGPGEGLRFRWPRWQLYACFDSDPSDTHRHEDAPLMPAIATVLADSPPPPTFAFVRIDDGHVRLILQAVN